MASSSAQQRAMAVSTHRDHPISLHHADLDILRSSLNHLQQGFDCELDRIVPRKVVGVILLKEFSDSLG